MTRWAILFIIVFSEATSAQTWAPLGEGASGPIMFLYEDTLMDRLIVGGSFQMAGGLQADRIATWDGTLWDTLANGISNTSPVYSACRFQGDVYTEGLNALLKLTENGWLKVGNTAGGTISKMRVIDDRIYVVGFLDSIGGVVANGVAAWDGTQWHSIGNDLDPVYLSDVAEYEGELYVVGKFDNGNGLVNIAKLVDGTWQPVGGGIPAFDGWAADLLVYKEKLYVAGFFDQWQGNAGHNIMAWDGSAWDALQGGLQHSNGAGFLRSMSTDGEYLYVAGFYDSGGGLPLNGFARWDGANWCGIYNPYPDGTPMALAHFKDKLVMAQPTWDSVNGVVHYIMQSDYFVDSCTSVGIEEESYSYGSVSIYPNPSTGPFTLSWQGTATEPYSLMLYDAQGRAVQTHSGQATAGPNAVQLELSHLPSGIYFGRLAAGEEVRSFKWVRE